MKNGKPLHWCKRLAQTVKQWYMPLCHSQFLCMSRCCEHLRQAVTYVCIIYSGTLTRDYIGAGHYAANVDQIRGKVARTRTIAEWWYPFRNTAHFSMLAHTIYNFSYITQCVAQAQVQAQTILTCNDWPTHSLLPGGYKGSGYKLRSSTLPTSQSNQQVRMRENSPTK